MGSKFLYGERPYEGRGRGGAGCGGGAVLDMAGVSSGDVSAWVRAGEVWVLEVRRGGGELVSKE